MVHPLSFKKHIFIFGKGNQTSILNLQPHLQDPTSNPRWITTHTDMHTLLFCTGNLSLEHNTFTAIFMWNNANDIDKCYKNIY
jgi:hypothetical protein